MRFTNVMLAYFVTGAVMWASGAIGWGEVGLAEWLIADPATGETTEAVVNQLEQLGGPIEQFAGALGGPLLVIWGFVQGILSWVLWPISVMIAVEAPVRLTIVFGGAMVMGFIGGLLRLLRGTA